MKTGWAARAGLWAIAALALDLCACRAVLGIGDLSVDEQPGDTGGGGADGGAGGADAGEPATSDKVDLLLMVDNSASMADKQHVLANTIPALVGNLVNPPCIGSAGTTQPKTPTEKCPSGTARAFEPVLDMHIGIIDSSLGGHGADACSPALAASYDPTMADMAHLIDRGDAITTYQGKHFLAWDPTGFKDDPPGESAEPALTANLANMIVGVAQTGCGFEAPLEAVYRFLSDPAPYGAITVVNGVAERQGYDDVLLQERADFLRPDSLVAVLYVTDENDASGIDGGQNYVGWQATAGGANFHLPRATSACAATPNDPCCYSCAQSTPSGCPDKSQDPECQQDGGTWDDYGDQLNLRAFHQKQRFGIDFLYPTSRYADGLTNPMVPDETGALVKNPLFSDLQCATSGQPCKPDRSPSLVLAQMIVGVPWQDLAVDPLDLSQGYLTPGDLASKGLWDVILGDPSSGTNPTDPLMIESIAPRKGTNPVTGDPTISPAAASIWNANPINGHEWSADLASRGDDLQYACVFALGALDQRDCSTTHLSCDCIDGDQTHNPLCQDPTTGAYGKKQFAAKAYPCLRQLEVAKKLGDRGLVASICPANVDPTKPDGGYGPAVAALVRAMTPLLVR